MRMAWLVLMICWQCLPGMVRTPLAAPTRTGGEPHAQRAHSAVIEDSARIDVSSEGTGVLGGHAWLVRHCFKTLTALNHVNSQ